MDITAKDKDGTRFVVKGNKVTRALAVENTHTAMLPRVVTVDFNTNLKQVTANTLGNSSNYTIENDSVDAIVYVLLHASDDATNTHWNYRLYPGDIMENNGLWDGRISLYTSTLEADPVNRAVITYWT